MTSTEFYRLRRSKGLCISCGDKTDGSARCEWCKKRFRLLQQERFKNMSEEDLKAYKEYQRAYQEVYRRTRLTKEAKAASNRRYRLNNYQEA